MGEPIYLETSASWSYAVAIEWPGWARHAKGTADPIEALLGCGDRYGAALAAAGIEFTTPSELEVTDDFEGDSGTEWGVLSIVTQADHRTLDPAEAQRQVAILHAGWQAFDRAVAGAEGHELRKGPRGGGRDVPRIIDHCLKANQVYLSKLGARKPKVPSDDWHEIETAMRDRAVETFFDRAEGRPVREPSRTRELWPPRWFVRYAAWHALVHAWDIEDRRLD